MAKYIPDGFSSDSHIVRNSLHGMGNTLPHKQLDPAPTICRKKPKPHVLFVFDTLPHTLDSNPTSLTEAQSQPDWPKW